MTVHGKSDGDNSKKASLIKAQENGFGKAGVAGRPKNDATSVFEEKAIERMPTLVDKSLDALERAMSSRNEKTAADAAYKFTRLYYNPDQKIVIEGTNQQEVHYNLLLQQDNLSPEEREALNMFGDFLKEGIVEGNARELVELEGREIHEKVDNGREENSTTPEDVGGPSNRGDGEGDDQAGIE